MQKPGHTSQNRLQQKSGGVGRQKTNLILKMKGYTLRNATAADVEEMARIEGICFPPDEAADIDGVRYRIMNAGKFFCILEKESNVCGFINGTCTSHSVIHHDSMSTHDQAGTTLVIHSGMFWI